MNRTFRSIGIVVFILFQVLAQAQQIKKAEYFYDTDPGVGSGTAITLTQADSVDITTSMPTTSLGAGFHKLFIRTKNTNGLWSMYEARNFYINSTATTPSVQITKAEYFFDVDPGVGNGTSIATGSAVDSIDFTQSNISTTGLGTGFHKLFVRTKNELGLWSMYEGRNFYINSSSTTPSVQITKAEYFIDTDPGVGNGISITTGAVADSIDFTATSISTTGLSSGFHKLCVRTKNQLGLWGMYEARSFYIEAPNTVTIQPKITKAEYFFDTDPGVGNGISISTGALADSISIAQSISTTGLAGGTHSLFIRTKNQTGLWSLYEGGVFNICATVPVVNLGSDGGACSGTINLNAGNTGASYLWSTGELTQSITVSNTGTYWVQVSTAVGCSATDTINISIGQPQADITSSTLSACVGDSILLSANTGSNLVYQWKRNGINLTGATSANYYAKIAGSYTVIVSNVGACSTLSAATILTFNALPTSTISNGSSVVICSGSSIILNANGGVGNVYQWREGGINISGANSQNYNATIAGTFTVVVTANGCSATSAITTVSINQPPTATITPQATTTFCSGGSVALLANTGTGLTYQWQRNSTNITATAAGYNATISGSYTVIVTDANGCSNTSATEVVTVNPSVVPSVALSASQTTICSGDFVTFNATPTNGGTAPTYVWKKNNVVISGQTTASYTTSTIANGDQFTVVMTSNANCANPTTATAPLVNITVSAAVQAIAGITANDTSLCAGQNLLMLANNVQGGGTSPTYQWYKNGVLIIGATNITYNTTTAANNDYYTVEMTSNSSCAIGSPAMSSPQFVTVQNNVTPTVSITNQTGTACAGAPVNLFANATNTGTSPFFLWRVNGYNFAATSSPNFSPTNLQNNDIVTAIMFSSIECISNTFVVSNAITASITYVNYGLAFTASNVSLIQPPFNTQFNNSSIGAANVAYRWFFGDGTNIIAQSPSHQYAANGTYSVTLFAQDTITGCADTLRINNYITCSGGTGASFNCTQTVSISPSSTINGCVGGSATLTASTNAVTPSYQWNINGVPIGGATQSTFVASVNGFYSVTVYENGGCPKTSSVLLARFNINPPTAPTITQTGVISGCAGGSATLSASAGFTNYLWSNGATTQNITVTNSGLYTVTGINANGCQALSNPKIINNSYLTAPEICLVTVDTVNNKNLIAWNKSNYSAAEVDSFIVMKEGIYAGVYNRIGARDYNQLSEFTDVASNALARADRYKIAIKDSCGNLTLPSGHYKTMHLQITPGIGLQRNLSWTHAEGIPFSYYYRINRWHQGTWTTIDSVQSNLNTYTDLNLPDINVDYIVEIILSQPCISSKSIQGARVRCTSNGGTNRTLLLSDLTSIEKVESNFENSLRIYPNPAKDVLNVEVSSRFSVLNSKLVIMDVVGKEVSFNYLPSTNDNILSINIEPLSKGVYFVRLGNTVKKLVVE